jgi:hypothetical protein
LPRTLLGITLDGIRFASSIARHPFQCHARRCRSGAPCSFVAHRKESFAPSAPCPRPAKSPPTPNGLHNPPVPPSPYPSHRATFWTAREAAALGLFSTTQLSPSTAPLAGMACGRWVRGGWLGLGALPDDPCCRRILAGRTACSDFISRDFVHMYLLASTSMTCCKGRGRPIASDLCHACLSKFSFVRRLCFCAFIHRSELRGVL